MSLSVLLMRANGECRFVKAEWNEPRQRFLLENNDKALKTSEIQQWFKWRATLPGTPAVSFFEIELQLDNVRLQMPPSSELVRVPLLRHLLLYAPIIMTSFQNPRFGNLTSKQLEINWQLWLKSIENQNVDVIKPPIRSRIKLGVTAHKHITVSIMQKPKHQNGKRSLVQCGDNDPSEDDVDNNVDDDNYEDDEEEEVLDDEKLVDEDDEQENEEEEEEEEECDNEMECDDDEEEEETDEDTTIIAKQKIKKLKNANKKK